MDSRCCCLVHLESCLGRRPLFSFLLYIGRYFKALSVLMMQKLKERSRALFSSRGCLGCCMKPPLITSVDEPSKGPNILGNQVNKHSITEDFWSSSTCEMDDSTFPSQRSIWSISTLNQVNDPNSSSGSTSNPPEFVNHGFLLWNQMRQQWVGDKGSKKPKQIQEPKLCWDATSDILLGSNKPFPQPIPLSEMVDFLVDSWEQEGLYD